MNHANVDLSHISINAFSYFSIKYYFYKKFKSSNKDYLLLIFKFLRMLNISKTHSLKFPKSQNVHYNCGFGNDAESVWTVLKYVF